MGEIYFIEKEYHLEGGIMLLYKLIFAFGITGLIVGMLGMLHVVDTDNLLQIAVIIFIITAVASLFLLNKKGENETKQ